MNGQTMTNKESKRWTVGTPNWLGPDTTTSTPESTNVRRNGLAAPSWEPLPSRINTPNGVLERWPPETASVRTCLSLGHLVGGATVCLVPGSNHKRITTRTLGNRIMQPPILTTLGWDYTWLNVGTTMVPAPLGVWLAPISN